MRDMYLGAYWRARQISLGDYIADVRAFLAELHRLHPIFGRLYEAGDAPDSLLELSDDLGNLDEVALRRAFDKRSDDFSEVGPNGIPTLNAVAGLGYSLLFRSGKGTKIGDCEVSISISAGKEDSHLVNAVTVEFPRAGHAEFDDPAFVARLMQVVVTRWQPHRALVASRDFRDLTYDDDTGFAVGWMTYLDSPQVCGLVPRGVQCKPLEGGSLITFSSAPPVADDVMTAARATNIRDALRILAI